MIVQYTLTAHVTDDPEEPFDRVSVAEHIASLLLEHLPLGQSETLDGYWLLIDKWDVEITPAGRSALAEFDAVKQQEQ